MEKKTFSLLGFGLLAMTVATLASQTLLAVVVSMVDYSFASSTAFTYLSVTMFYLLGLPALWLFVRRLPALSGGEQKPITLKSTAVGFGVSLGVTYIFNYLGYLLILLVGLLRGSEVPNTVGALLSSGELFWNILIICICSPIVEEIVFRKILLDRLKPFGDRVAIVYSAVAFGLFHMNLYQFFYAVALGMVFAYITLRTGSIKQSIILHMLVNFFGSVVSNLATQYGGVPGTAALGVVVIAAIIFTIVWLVCHRRALRLDGPRFSFSRPITKKLVWLNAGTLCYLVLCAVFFVLNTFLV